MSRTIRRKNDTLTWKYYATEGEFNSSRECALNDYSEMLKNKPAYPTKPRWVKQMDWDSCTIRYVLNTHPQAVAEWDAWHKYINSDEYISFRIGVRFIRETRNAKTYKEYVRNLKKEMTRDSRCGRSWSQNAPAWYCNLEFERPMRRSVKRALKYAYKYDTFDETVYDETINGAAWSYW